MSEKELEELNEWIHVNLFDGDKYVGLKKRGAWYRPDAKGYTDDQRLAGRYTREEAKKHEYPHDEPVTIHEFDAPRYTTNPADAFAVLEKCVEKMESHNVNIWRGVIYNLWFVGKERGEEIFCKGETLQQAICLFAKQLFSTP